MNPEREALIAYRLDRADHALRQAAALADISEWFGVVNRAYYAMFYAALALLASHDLKARRHVGVLSLIDRQFALRGALAREQASALRRAFRLRQEADYLEATPVDAEAARGLVDDARSFVSAVRDALARSEV